MSVYTITADIAMNAETEAELTEAAERAGVTVEEILTKIIEETARVAFTDSDEDITEVVRQWGMSLLDE